MAAAKNLERETKGRGTTPNSGHAATVHRTFAQMLGFASHSEDRRSRNVALRRSVALRMSAAVRRHFAYKFVTQNGGWLPWKTS